MNGRIIGLAAITVIAVGALGVLGTWRLASAWGPDVTGDGTVTAADILAVVQSYSKAVPTEVPSREQNVDASGNIKVHEQGVVDVNVPTLPHKLYTLADNVTLNDGQTFTSTYADVRGCDFFRLVERWNPGGSLNNAAGAIRAFGSVDGIADDLLVLNGEVRFRFDAQHVDELTWPGNTVNYPYLRFEQTNGQTVAPQTETLNMFLYCYP